MDSQLDSILERTSNTHSHTQCSLLSSTLILTLPDKALDVAFAAQCVKAFIECNKAIVAKGLSQNAEDVEGLDECRYFWT